MQIEITSRPAGEAPEWVRDQWIGLILPTVGHQPRRIMGFGVLTGPKSLIGDVLRLALGQSERHEGYPVEVETAIRLLEVRSPEAAAWWRENTPHLFKWRRRFVFDSECCCPAAKPALRSE